MTSTLRGSGDGGKAKMMLSDVGDVLDVQSFFFFFVLNKIEFVAP